MFSLRGLCRHCVHGDLLGHGYPCWDPLGHLGLVVLKAPVAAQAASYPIGLLDLMAPNKTKDAILFLNLLSRLH